jgi:NhaP-type Na+/H+ or K+/H+ antiporter
MTEFLALFAIVFVFTIGLGVELLNEMLQWSAIVGAVMTIITLMVLNNIKLSVFIKTNKDKA